MIFVRMLICLILLSTVLWAQPSDISKPGDVLINEVMANPKGLTELPETEYVEIHNTLNKTLVLNGYTFIYDKREIAIPDTTLPADGYVLLYRQGRAIKAAEGALTIGISKFPANLANNGKYIALKNAEGVVIDEFNYPKAHAAKSHERAADNTWHLSTDPRGGTPGSANSSVTPPTPPEPPEPPKPLDPPLPSIEIKRGEIVFNEILADPFIGGSEYVELYNRSGRILPVSGLAIATRKTDGSLGTLYSLKSLKDSIYPDHYMVLTSNPDGVSGFYHMPSPRFLYELKLPALKNSGATLVLLQPADSSIIDEVSYSSDWHDIAIKNMKGVSLERISPDRNSQDASNWTSAVAEVGYGTPGYKNSQFKSPDTENKTSVDAPEYIHALDYYIIRYRTNKTGYRCRIEIYSTSGTKLAETANNRLLSLDGEIKWDGKGLDGGRLSSGIYVFFAELYHPDGDCKRIKKAFLVH